MMKTINEIAEKLTSPKIKETFFHLDCTFFINDLSLDFISTVQDFLTSVPQRDTITCMIEIWGSVIGGATWADCLEEAKRFIAENLDDWNKEQEPIDGINISIFIEKSVEDNNLSIYSLDAFGDSIKNRSVLATLKDISKFVGDRSRLVFQCFDNNAVYGSDRIQFIPNGSNLAPCLFDRKKHADKYREFNLDTNCPGNLFTEDFLVDENQSFTNDSIINFFSKAKFILALSAISDSFKITTEDKVRFTVSGYRKSTVEEKNISEITNNKTFEALFDIQSWAYSDGETIDKLHLARNILSLHVENGEVVFSKEAFLAIKSNYNIYLHENVEKYIEVKNKITEIVIQSSIKNSELCDSFLAYFRGNCLVLLTFFLSAFFIKSVDSEAAYTTNTNILMIASVVLLFLSWCWLFFIRSDLKKRFKHNRDLLNSTIVNNYKNILVEKEIDNFTKGTYEKNATFFEESLRKYTFTWTITSVVLVALYILILLVLAANNVPGQIEI